MTRDDRIRIRAYEICSGRAVQMGVRNTIGSQPRARSMRRTLRSGFVKRMSDKAMKVQPINVRGGKVRPRTVLAGC